MLRVDRDIEDESSIDIEKAVADRRFLSDVLCQSSLLFCVVPGSTCVSVVHDDSCECRKSVALQKRNRHPLHSEEVASFQVWSALAGRVSRQALAFPLLTVTAPLLSGAGMLVQARSNAMGLSDGAQPPLSGLRSSTLEKRTESIDSDAVRSRMVPRIPVRCPVTI